MADSDKNYFDPKVLAGISNLALRARWVVEGLLSGVHKAAPKASASSSKSTANTRRGTRSAASTGRRSANSTAT